MATQSSYYGDGSNRSFSITFPYRVVSEIVVTVDTVSVPFTFLSPSAIQTLSAPAAGSRVVVKRVTSVEVPDVVFEDGSVLTDNDLNESQRQLLYRLQEITGDVTEIGQSALRTKQGLAPRIPDFVPGGLWGYAADGSLVTYSGNGNGDAALRTDLAGATGAQRLGWQAPGSTVVRAQSAINADVVSVRERGALGNGDPAYDIGAILQYLHDNRLGPDGGVIELPPGPAHYVMLTPFVATKPVTIRGSTERSSQILTNVPNIVMLSFANWFAVEGIEFLAYGPAAKTATIIKGLQGATGQNHSRIVRSKLVGGKYAVHHQSSNQLHVDGNSFGSYEDVGLLMENKTNADTGDSYITNNSFEGGNDPTKAIAAQLKTAGIYWMNNKIFGPHAFGVYGVSRPDNDGLNVGNIGNLNFHGGSIEGVGTQNGDVYTGTSLYVTSTDGRITDKVQVIGVQFSGQVGTHIQFDGITTTSVVSGCVFNGAIGHTVAIRATPTARGGTITGNIFRALGLAMDIQAPGWNIDGSNRFGDAVTSIFNGPSAIVAHDEPSHQTLRVGKKAISTGGWVNVLSWKGAGDITARAIGFLEGAGPAQKKYVQSFFGTTRKAAVVEENATADAISIQVITSGDNNLLQVQRGTASGGTSLNLNMDIELSGYPTAVTVL